MLADARGRDREPAAPIHTLLKSLSLPSAQKWQRGTYRCRRTRTRLGTLRMPFDQRNLLSSVSILTSSVPIVLRAKSRIACRARGARFLKVLRERERRGDEESVAAVREGRENAGRFDAQWKFAVDSSQNSQWTFAAKVRSRNSQSSRRSARGEGRMPRVDAHSRAFRLAAFHTAPEYQCVAEQSSEE